jgi:four helix bundle protein
MNTYRELKVWQKAIDLVVACYELTKGFPDDERYGLTSQLRRAAVSVPANIAEGHGRGSTSQFLNFLWIANGSLTEVETHLIIAGRLGYISRDVGRPIFHQMQEIGRMLSGLRRSLLDATNHGVYKNETADDQS